jgi:hypothetical protein
MRTYLWILIVSIAAGCGKDSTASKAEAFFVDWLKAHGETDVVTDAGGVGIANNATRLRASLHSSKRQEDGSFIVETEFRVRLPSGGEIVEFVAGTAKTEEQAVKASFVNFMLTTFHVVYKSFMNPADPHLTVSRIEMDGRQRELVMGDILLTGSPGEPMDVNPMRAKVQAAVGLLHLPEGPHWIKVVYAQVDGRPMTAAATVDNEGHEQLTAAIEQLGWPRRDGFYMAKQFLVLK